MSPSQSDLAVLIRSLLVECRWSRRRRIAFSQDVMDQVSNRCDKEIGGCSLAVSNSIRPNLQARGKKRVGAVRLVDQAEATRISIGSRSDAARAAVSRNGPGANRSAAARRRRPPGGTRPAGRDLGQLHCSRLAVRSREDGQNEQARRGPPCASHFGQYHAELQGPRRSGIGSPTAETINLAQ